MVGYPACHRVNANQAYLFAPTAKLFVQSDAAFAPITWWKTCSLWSAPPAAETVTARWQGQDPTRCDLTFVRRRFITARSTVSAHTDVARSGTGLRVIFGLKRF